MKKITALSLILTIFLGLFGKITNAETSENYFIVTAYYSPLPNQQYYMMGDFESEKILQGNGIRGASGREVFSGMFAAPSKYNFGTKIYLEGIGIGEVTDRGGAIVQAGKKGHKYDRIDVWMGYGDEGLKRALAWGKRTVKGNIVSNNSKITFNYKNRIAPDWAVKGLKASKNREIIFDYDIGKDSSKKDIKNLQKFFKKIGIYRGEINGNYMGETVEIVFDFQLANSIISDENDFGAGYWGTKTRALFKKMYLNGEFKVIDLEKKVVKKDKKVEKIKEKSETQLELENLENKLNEEIKKIEKKKDKTIFSNFSQDDEEIKFALEKMKILGIYNGKIDLGYKKFINVVYDFQLKNGIIKKESDEGAGYFGPKTRTKLKEIYFSYLDKEIEKLRKNYEKQKEDLLQESRKKELEQKYKEIEENALTKTSKKIKKIGVLKRGETSENVRELQNTLKELGFYHYDDTAFFGDITKKAVSDFQLKYDLIDSLESQYAGILGERTLEKLGNVLYEKYCKDEEKLLETNYLVASI